MFSSISDDLDERFVEAIVCIGRFLISRDERFVEARVCRGSVYGSYDMWLNLTSRSRRDAVMFV